MSNWSESQIAIKLRGLRDRWFPKILIEAVGSEFRYSIYRGGEWLCADELPPEQSWFEQKTLLMPDSISFFKLRSFPIESVSRQALEEAVELDLARWSPWQDDVEFYYWPKRSGEQWQVAVWVWQREDLSSITRHLSTDPTHVIPERAWKLASQGIKSSDFIQVDVNEDKSWTYSEVAEDFSTLRIVQVKTKTDARRFFTALKDEATPVCIDAQVEPSSLPEEMQQHCSVGQYTQPVSSALSGARQPGISDWADPFVWAKPIGAVLALYIFWLLGSGFVLLKHGKEVREYSVQAGAVSNEVLIARAEVERLNGLLEHINQMRTDQPVLGSILASLSVALPRNAWLEHMEYRADEDGWLEITGKSDQSASLAAVLEQMPEVAQAMFLVDIRKEKGTGLEPFKIRLKLAKEK